MYKQLALSIIPPIYVIRNEGISEQCHNWTSVKNRQNLQAPKVILSVPESYEDDKTLKTFPQVE
jgi:hypothetical protein